jgi:group I intron endonuclease
MLTCIYAIVHADTGRRYIGQTVDFERREANHRTRLRGGYHHGKHLQAAWDQYGEAAFYWEVLEECDPEALTSREQFWMDALRPEFNSAPAAGSPRGFKHTPETRQKMADAHRGGKHTAETRRRMSEAAKRRWDSYSPERRSELTEIRRNRAA